MTFKRAKNDVPHSENEAFLKLVGHTHFMAWVIIMYYKSARNEIGG